MCEWSIPITIPNQSQVAALVAKKKRALDINIYGPLGPSTFVSVAKTVTGFHPRNMAHKRAKFGPWGYFSFWGRGGATKFKLGPLGPLTFVSGAQKIGGFHPCNILHKCAKFGHWGYFNFWVTVEQRKPSWEGGEGEEGEDYRAEGEYLCPVSQA